ncbi:MAG: maleylpyruvate isomerase family mycothiol-dependent enzyme [Anaerolineae bacterium]|nr:maleylpyruvate isomerase family mycothiol-dependent enzyme [Anaerolineae bacterium]
MAEVELERFTALLETLAEDDWLKPTYCPLWNIHQVVSHQAGAYAGFAKWAEFRRQWGPMLQPKPGQITVDAVNDIQVADRAGATPAELIAELRRVGPQAIATRQRIPAVIRGLRFDFGAFLYAWRPHEILRALRWPYGPTTVAFKHREQTWKGAMRLDYITDLIYTRDTWMHRIDICLASGREMVLTDDHDGRIMALIVRDLAGQLKDVLDGKSVVYDIPGPGGGCWKIGPASTPAATIRMDLLYFNVLASGRITPDEARAQGLVSISGDVEVANLALDHMSPLTY